MHGFDLTPGEARRLQGELASRVEVGPALDLGGVRHVAGADVSTQGDIFDAITSARPYRAAGSTAAALDEIRRCAGTQFDPQVVAALTATVAEAREGEGACGS